jgi:hypothetical protein
MTPKGGSLMSRTVQQEMKIDFSKELGKLRRDADAGGGIEGHPHRVRIVAASAVSICSVYRA